MAETQGNLANPSAAGLRSASSTALGSAVSNPYPGSSVTVPVADTTLRWEIQNNAFGDTLPIIPSSSRVQSGKVLYELKVKIALTQVSEGIPVSGKSVTIKSSRNGDVITPAVLTSGADGTVQLILQSRNPGDLHLSVKNGDVTADLLAINLKDAWYENTFLITGYNVCDESDFGSQMTEASGLGDQHRYDFLYGASGVIMQGTGRALNGRYVRFVHMATTWHLNDHTHHRDHIQDPEQVTFAYTNNVQGSFGPVTENHSIAVDKTVIPPHAHVNIEGVGDRYADDRGSAIVGNHIDNFLGTGAGVVQIWMHGGVNGTQRRVKYIGA
jgi:3D (Asp-Asp-Asp) domain-containing protein